MRKNETLSKGEATRSRIIDAAYHLFVDQGYHGTSMRQIVDAAGITMGGIYNHFANKEAIWKAVFIAKHPYHEIIPLLLESEGETIAEIMQDGANRLISELGRRSDLLYLMFIEIVELKGKNIPAMSEEILPEISKIGRVFLKKNGKLRDIPLPIVTRSFAGLIFSYFITEIFMPEHVRKMMGTNALDEFVNIYLYGILDSQPEG